MIPTSKSTISWHFWAILWTFLHMNFDVVKPMRDLVRLGRFFDQSNPLGEIRWFQARNPKNENFDNFDEIEKIENLKKMIAYMQTGW